MKLILPKSREEWLELRTRYVTSTEVSSLYGCNPYMTKFELWHLKKSKEVIDIASNDRMKWGKRLEGPIARGIGVDQNWVVIPMEEFGFDDDLKIGSSFDYKFKNGAREGLLEVKNVDALAFKDGWLVENDSIEAPPHIELQLQHQLLVSGYKFAYIGALVGGNKTVILERHRDEEIIESIKKEIAAFWKSIKEDCPPQPDFARDAAFISRLYASSKGKEIDDKEDKFLSLVQQYNRAQRQEVAAKSLKESFKAQILMQIGDAPKVKGLSYTISAKEAPEKVIPSYTRKAYRGFRVYLKKEKDNGPPSTD